jgi:hypothetical protein
MWIVIDDYWRYYHRFVWDAWQSLGPNGYVSILAFIGVFGFIAMKGKKRH